MFVRFELWLDMLLCCELRRRLQIRSWEGVSRAEVYGWKRAIILLIALFK